MNQTEKIEQFAKDNNVPIMMKDGIEFLISLVKEYKPRTILELGTAVGYSSILMAKCSSEIHIDTIELKEDMYKIAIQNITEANLNNQITLYNLNIDDFVTDNKYDLIFVDAAKGQYHKYYDKFKGNLTESGIMVFDNLNFHGMVDNPTLIKSRNTRQLCKKIRKFREFLLTSSEIITEYYQNVGDGVAVVKIR